MVRYYLPPTLVTIQSGIHSEATANPSAMRNKVNEMTESLSTIYILSEMQATKTQSEVSQ